MALNPTAAEFTPKPVTPMIEERATEDVAGVSSPISGDISTASPTASLTHRQRAKAAYKEKRRAVIHSIMRDTYDAAKMAASYDGDVVDENAKDKLIVDLVRLLAGLGWGTSTVLRAVALLEVDPRQDATECLDEAWKLGEEFHGR